jgi:hypothetical protein
MWGLEFLAWPLRSLLQRFRGSFALSTRESVNVCNYPFSSRVCPLIHLSVIILNLGLLSHYILPRFSLTRVSNRPTFSFSFLIKKNLSGLSLIYLGQVQEGLAELEDATRQHVTEEHSVIDEAIRDRGQGYTVFSIVRVKGCL